jgi:hypothetical protein
MMYVVLLMLHQLVLKKHYQLVQDRLLLRRSVQNNFDKQI